MNNGRGAAILFRRSTRQGECLPNEVYVGIAAARTLRVENDAPGFHHRMKRNVSDFFLMEHELHQRLLHNLFLARPRSGSRDMQSVGEHNVGKRRPTPPSAFPWRVSACARYLSS
jgi:hypothetical protein